MSKKKMLKNMKKLSSITMEAMVSTKMSGYFCTIMNDFFLFKYNVNCVVNQQLCKT